jgi:hypothetical protein
VPLIDLPLKILVWPDEAGSTWVSYNDPSRLATRHGLGDDVRATMACGGTCGYDRSNGRPAPMSAESLRS